MNTEFKPQVRLEKGKFVFNNEAVETMNLDMPESKVMLIDVVNPEAKRKSNELLIVKTNGSSLDKPEDVIDIIPKEKTDRIRNVTIKENSDGSLEASVETSEDLLLSLKETFGENAKEFKLIVCNSENKIAKEFKDVFDIQESFYRIVKLGDKRVALGKEKEIKNENEERIKL